ncbi:hypothetical protein QQ045_021180 [Rhodiola kirilowii]
MSSSDMVREMIKTHDFIFSNRPKTRASQMLFNGSENLVFSSNTHFWREGRKQCVNELLSIKQVESSHFIIEEEVGELVAKIRSIRVVLIIHVEYGRPSSAIDLGDSFCELSSNIIFRAVLGQKCTDDHGAMMRRLGKEATQLLTSFSFAEYIPLLSWLDTLTGFNRNGMRISRALHEFVDRFIDEQYENNQQAVANGGQNDSKAGFVIHMINQIQTEKSGQSFTRENIKAIILLARHPRIMKKVQDEIRSIIGADHQQRINQHDIKQMEYLHCVVKESLRLHSPSITGRLSSADVTIGGFKVPENSFAIVNSWTIHRDPLTWDSPLQFLPERFLNMTTSADYSGQDYKYFPFGVGRRICPGAHLAITEVEYALANLLFWFNWDLSDGMSAEDLDMSVTTSQATRKKISLCLIPSTAQP